MNIVILSEFEAKLKNKKLCVFLFLLCSLTLTYNNGILRKGLICSKIFTVAIILYLYELFELIINYL